MVDIRQGSAGHAVDGPDVPPAVHHQGQPVHPPRTVHIRQCAVELSHFTEHHKELCEENNVKSSDTGLHKIISLVNHKQNYCYISLLS